MNVRRLLENLALSSIISLYYWTVNTIEGRRGVSQFHKHFMIHRIDYCSIMGEPIVHGTHEAKWITISTDEYESMKRTIDETFR